MDEVLAHALIKD